MTTIPEGAKKPADHKSDAAPTEAELRKAIAEEKKLLDGLTALPAPEMLDQVDVNRILALASRIQKLANPDTGELDVQDLNDLSDPKATEALDIIAAVDTFALSIATDADGYRLWRSKNRMNKLLALLMSYSRAVGE